MTFYPESGSFDPAQIKLIYKKLALEAFSEAKAEMLADVRNELPARDVRMAALHLAQHLAQPDKIVEFADSLAQYVLTGKKPGEA